MELKGLYSEVFKKIKFFPSKVACLTASKVDFCNPIKLSVAKIKVSYPSVDTIFPISAKV